MITFTITPANETGKPFDVTATSRDVYTWEKSGRGRSVAQLQNGGTMEAMYQIAHVACRRLKLFGGTLVEFLDSVDLVPKDEGEPDQVRAALAEELAEWRELAENVPVDDWVAQLDERIERLREKPGADPTHAGATPAT